MDSDNSVASSCPMLPSCWHYTSPHWYVSTRSGPSMGQLEHRMDSYNAAVLLLSPNHQHYCVKNRHCLPLRSHAISTYIRHPLRRTSSQSVTRRGILAQSFHCTRMLLRSLRLRKGRVHIVAIYRTGGIQRRAALAVWSVCASRQLSAVDGAGAYDLLGMSRGTLRAFHHIHQRPKASRLSASCLWTFADACGLDRRLAACFVLGS